jgi:hypothetical protein
LVMSKLTDELRAIFLPLSFWLNDVYALRGLLLLARYRSFELQKLNDCFC